MTVVYFDWLDYVVFGGMLLLSALIGIYFAFFAIKKQNTTAEYLMGGKTMGMFPISMSLIANYISGISLLGLPAEMYTYGTQLWTIVLSEWVVSVTIALVYLPVFYNLQITSTYEGGLKAVVWTDTLQTVLMYFGVVFVLGYGTWRLGGVSNVLSINAHGERLDFFNLDVNPTIRHTFWSTVFGNYFSWLASCSVNQVVIQRCLSLSSLRRARITIFIMAVGMFIIVSLCCYTGLVIYATFATCDPLTTGAIRKIDQLLPYFVMTITESIPALPGIFISGVFSAVLSSMSTGLNSLCGVIFEDLIRPAYNKLRSDKTASFIMKVIVVAIGATCVTLVFLVEHMGALMQAGRSLGGITDRSLLGLFSMGLFLPWVNVTGALTGGIISTILVGWISLGTQAAMLRGEIYSPTKPESVAGCPGNFSFPANTTFSFNRMVSDRSGTFFLYRLSYLYYTFIGMTVCMIVGAVVSFFTHPNDPTMVHRDLLTPVIHRRLPAQSPHCRRPRLTQHDIELHARELQALRAMSSYDVHTTSIRDT